MLFRLKEIFREKGFRGAIRYIFAKLTGRQAIEDSLKPSAAESFRSLYASLGIERVIVEWESGSQAHEVSTKVE